MEGLLSISALGRRMRVPQAGAASKPLVLEKGELLGEEVVQRRELLESRASARVIGGKKG